MTFAEPQLAGLARRGAGYVVGLSPTAAAGPERASSSGIRQSRQVTW